MNTLQNMCFISTLAVFLFFSVTELPAATCESVRSGNWHESATWRCDGEERLPSSGDAIVVKPGHTVSIAVPLQQLTGSAVMVFVRGTLTFSDAQAQLALPQGSGVEITGQGLLLPFGAAANTAKSDMFCETTDRSGNAILLDTLVGWAGSCGAAKAFTDIGNALTLLPVEFVSVQAEVHMGKAKLTWEVAEEDGGGEYLIERSGNGRDWAKVGQVRAVAGRRLYTYSESPQSNGTIYYRVVRAQEQIVKLSKTVSIEWRMNAQSYIFPTQVSDGLLYVACHLPEGEQLSYKVWDSMGKMMKSDIVLDQNTQGYRLELNELPVGNYLIEWMVGAQIQRSKFVVR